MVGLLGPNGAGKTTMIRAIAGRVALDSGSIQLFGRTVTARDPRPEIGVVPQELAVYSLLTARENLAFFAGLGGVADPAAAAALALSRAGLADRADDPVSSFSRGMRQRVALERALIHAPRLVLLDEPFTGLDDASTAMLVARLQGLRDDGAIVIVATHDLDLAEGLLDHALFLRDGRVVESLARPEALRARYRALMSRSQ